MISPSRQPTEDNGDHTRAGVVRIWRTASGRVGYSVQAATPDAALALLEETEVKVNEWKRRDDDQRGQEHDADTLAALLAATEVGVPVSSHDLVGRVGVSYFDVLRLLRGNSDKFVRIGRTSRTRWMRVA